MSPGAFKKRGHRGSTYCPELSAPRGRIAHCAGWRGSGLMHGRPPPSTTGSQPKHFAPPPTPCALRCHLLRLSLYLLNVFSGILLFHPPAPSAASFFFLFSCFFFSFFLLFSTFFFSFVLLFLCYSDKLDDSSLEESLAVGGGAG